MVTPRGYYREQEKGEVGKGQEIMMNSFRKIEEEMQNKEIDLDRKWALFHAIHTTADFEMEKLVYTDKEVVKNLYEQIASGRIKTIITDVTMVAAGIRKGALQRLGVEVKCYLSGSKRKGTPVRGYCSSRRICACERVEIHDKDIHGSTEDYRSGQTGRK